MEVTLINVGDIIAYGLRCVSSNLKKNGISTKMIFIPPRFTDISHKNLFPGIMDIAKNSAFIGISLTAGQFKSAVYLTENLKKITDMPICWGGVHPTICPEDCIKYADIVCIGEAEETAVALAKRLEENKDLEGVNGVCFKRGREVVKNPPREIPMDLDLFPAPDHEFGSHYIFDYEKGKMAEMNEDYFVKYRTYRYTTLPTRGCAMSCTYCINGFLHKANPASYKLRRKSVDNVISELRWAKENLPFVREINFYDDDFMRLPVDYLSDFVDKYGKYINLPLGIMGISPHNFSEEKFELIRKRIRLSQLRLGIQSGSEKTRRKIYNRGQSDMRLFEIINSFSKVKKECLISYDVILDNPWETEKERLETFRFLMKIPKPFRLIVYYLTFYPGTVLYEKAKKEGLLSSNNDGFSQRYQTPRKRDTLNKIIETIDKWPKWVLWTLFYTRKIPLVSDIFLLISDVLILLRKNKERIIARLPIVKRKNFKIA